MQNALRPASAPELPPGPAAPSWMDPSQAGAVLRRRWVAFLAGLGAVFPAIALLTWLLPETFLSSASFLVEQRAPTTVTPALALLERMGTGRGTETEIELIRSRGVLAPVVEELALHVEQRDEGPRVIPFLEAVERVQERIAVSAVNPNADLIGLSCEGRSPEEAQRLCAAVSASYLRLRSSLQREEADAAAAFLSEQVEQVREQLAAAEDRLRGYEGRNQAVALGDQATEGIRQLAELRAQRDQLDAERTALRSWTEGLESQEGGAERFRNLAVFPTFLRDQTQLVTQLANSLVELENERSRLVVARTARAPEVVAVDARIGEIEGQLQGLATSYERALGAQIAALDGALARSGAALDEIPAQQVESARLRREVTLLDELYAFLETRLHEAEVARAVNLPSVRVIDPASLPFEASWPVVPLNLGLGLFLGLVSGAMAVVYREHTDRRLRERLDVEHEAGVPVLGMVPHLRRGGPLAALAGVRGGARLPHAIIEAGPEQEVALEAFRSVLADLRFSMQRAGRELRCVAVTSASRGEGKTFTACNLALAHAASGGRAMVVDTDVRASGVARFFNLPPRGPGLSDVLLGDEEFDGTLEHFDVIEGAGVTVLPAGRATHRGAALLDGPAFGQLLARLRAEPGLVIVDTPPLNVLTDAAMVAPQVDAVLVVVRGGFTEREALRLTLRRLSRADGRVVGVVLNDSRLPQHYTSYSHAT